MQGTTHGPLGDFFEPWPFGGFERVWRMALWGIWKKNLLDTKFVIFQDGHVGFKKVEENRAGWYWMYGG